MSSLELSLRITGQVKLSISFLFHSLCSFQIQYTYPEMSRQQPCSQFVKSSTYSIKSSTYSISAVFSMPNPCFNYKYAPFFSPPLPFQLFKSLLLAPSSKLTWTPSIFSFSFSLALYLWWSRKLRDVPKAQITHFLSPNMGKISLARADCWKSHFSSAAEDVSHTAFIKQLQG